ncbi:Cell division control protein 7 [Blastocladiella emersonii ATCC 22665]|nr:Cell division control protein 7 [Blastocladiella emersonii ATCC 22665]
MENDPSPYPSRPPSRSASVRSLTRASSNNSMVLSRRGESQGGAGPARPASRAALGVPLASLRSDEKRSYMKRAQTMVECAQLLHDWPELAAMYKIVGKIGEGTFSSVYKARDLHEAAPMQHQGKYVALKSIFPTSSESRILTEVKLLVELRGHPNVASMITLHRNVDKVVIVMPYYEHVDAKDYFKDLPMSELRYYFASMFAGLEFCHAKGIIHRDIKPSNFLYNPARRHGVLADFGLAQHPAKSWTQPLSKGSNSQPAPLSAYGRLSSSTSASTSRRTTGLGGLHPDDVSSLTSSSGRVHYATLPEFALGAKEPGIVINDSRPQLTAHRAGTRGFRAPEVLIKVRDQTTAIDVWSAGVTLLCFMTRRFPFFQSNDDVEALLEIAALFGRKLLKSFAAKHDRVLLCDLKSVPRERIAWRDLVYTLNPDEFAAIPSEAFQFLDAVMALDPVARMTAREAVKHEWLRGISSLGISG